MDTINPYIWKFVLSLTSFQKKAILGSIDVFTIAAALWCAFALRYSELLPNEIRSGGWALFIFTTTMSVFPITLFGLNRTVVRFLDLGAFKTIGMASCSIAFISFLCSRLTFIPALHVSVFFIFCLCTFSFLGISRLVIYSIYQSSKNVKKTKERMIIYGANSEGLLLCEYFFASDDFVPVAFVDSENAMWNRDLAGLPVFPASKLQRVIKEKNASTVTLTGSSLKRMNGRDMVQLISISSIEVKKIPPIEGIISGNHPNWLREIEIEDLLGRATVEPRLNLISPSIEDKSVCITGAGGSIGSELAIQAVRFGASKIVLFENSEFALYKINERLRQLIIEHGYECSVIPILGSVLDAGRVRDAFIANNVETVYHSAAYKHVPLIENNVVEGVENNVFGTAVVANIAIDTAVERFILISTDKAVRPTNFMGASKRMSELVVQDCAQSNSKTIFTSVRFGNVLGSSGSVVPIFQQQIKSLKPITITHPEVTRYFMTIPEAASLVMQAGSLSVGGEVFVLDMGEPVSILELAKSMIRLSGLTVKDEESPLGDIPIEIIGMRPGEKMHEELTIDGKMSSTAHPKIYAVNDGALEHSRLQETLDDLRSAVSDRDDNKIRCVLSSVVAGFAN